jgi:hypothetical protein
MSSHERPRRMFLIAPSPRERGFAYLMALFLVMVVIITSQVAVENLLTAGRRDHETDMIWRGNQYVRAVRLYYHKTGHYPQNLEELQKGLPELHFLRFAATKDPMSKTDGEWGFIYVNATGQIFGSVKYASLQQMALLDLNGGQGPSGPALAGTVPASSLASSPTSMFGASSSSSATATPSGATPDLSVQATPGSSPGAVPGAGSSAAQTSPFAGTFGAAAVATQKPTGPVDGPVLGAFLTGVVSKSSHSSVKVYKGGKKYSEWEFIWNPLEDQARAVQQGIGGAQGAVPGQPGQPAGALGSAFGLPPGQFSGSPAPGAPSPNLTQPQQPTP